MAPEQCTPNGDLGPPPTSSAWPRLYAASLPKRAPRELTNRSPPASDSVPDRPTAREFAAALEPLVAALPQQ